MAGRCCVPIHDQAGALIAYAGRLIEPDPEGPKWLLPKGFEKARVLFNAHRVAGASTVVLVEGFFDAIRLHGLGIPALALMGTAISEAQIALLREMGVRRAVLVMDGDEEGQAVVPDMVAALTPALFVHAVTLPEDADPASIPEADLQQALAGLGW
jgi:DNA primase